MIKTLEEYKNKYYSEGGSIPLSLQNSKKITIPDNIENQDSFIYKWVNLNNNMFYYGSRKGLPLVDYSFSSENKNLKKDFNKKNAKFSFEVTEWGPHEYILSKEKKILNEVNAKNNTLSYNLSNETFSTMKIPNIDKIQKMADEIIYQKQLTYNGVTYKRKICEKDFLKTIKKWYQPRFFDTNTDHLRNLKNELDDLGGNTEHLQVVILDFEDTSKRIGLDGKHSGGAITNCKKATDVHILFIPEEVHKDFSELEKKTFALRLNPPPKTPTVLKTTNDDLADLVFNYLKDGFSSSSLEIQKILDEYKVNSKDRKKIFKNANKLLKNFKKPTNWINYEEGSGLKEINKIVKKFNKGATRCVKYSSAGTGPYRLFREVFEHNLKASTSNVIKILRLRIYHPTPEAEKKWFSGLLQRTTKFLNHCMNRDGNDTDETNKHPVELIIEYMDTTKAKNI